jgi:PIN domain nuclease of toxin-antitoxin system
MSAPVRLLLDTHVFLWWRSDIGRMREAARNGIASAAAVFVSVASAWEAAIKISDQRIGAYDVPILWA